MPRIIRLLDAEATKGKDRQRQGSGALSWPSQARPEGIAAPMLPQSQGRQVRVGSPTSRALVATRRMLRRRFLAQSNLQVASWKKPTRRLIAIPVDCC